ncbi:hypothetical protein KAI04_01585 [Candidatus Pacearchaeota archaeon]|nr:hypothetical protein [Candidatus Pacearchaeota archaeon]
MVKRKCGGCEIKKEEESFFDQITEFLEYLGKTGHNEKARTKTNLIKKFSKEKFENVFDFCFNNRFVEYDLPTKDNIIRIAIKGIRFLEDHNQKKVLSEHNKTTLYLTTILVLTTILATFIGIRLTSPILLIIIYGIIVLGVTRIFKKNKIIKV